MKSAPPFLTAFIILLSLSVASEAAEPHHFFRFTERTFGGARSGTLRYQHDSTIISGPVFLRTSYYGDFLLLFTDDTGNKLIELQQDLSFARIRGQLVGTTWEGETRSAPSKLQGWLALSPLFVNQVVPLLVRKTVGNERFEFRFQRTRPAGHLGF